MSGTVYDHTTTLTFGVNITLPIEGDAVVLFLFYIINIASSVLIHGFVQSYKILFLLSKSVTFVLI